MAATHLPPALSLSPRRANSPTFVTPSHNLTFQYTTPPALPSHVLHAKFHEHIGTTPLTPAYQPWIHPPHCKHKTELAFTIKPQTPHGSTLLLDMPSLVMPTQTMTLDFPQITLKLMISKASFQFKNLFLSPSVVSLIRTKTSACSNSLSASSLANSVTISTTTAKRKGDSTDPW